VRTADAMIRDADVLDELGADALVLCSVGRHHELALPFPHRRGLPRLDPAGIVPASIRKNISTASGCQDGIPIAQLVKRGIIGSWREGKMATALRNSRQR
jgi:hypothetical protein